MSDKIEFRIATTKERPQVIEFVNRWGMKWEGCIPPPTNCEIVTAFKGDEVVGTIGMELAQKKGAKFPLEDIYDFDLVKECFPSFCRQDTVLTVRWFASVPNISLKLVQGVVDYTEPLGIKFILCEVKEHSVKRLEELGLKFSMLYGIKPNTEIVAEENMNYYKNGLPRLGLVNIKSVSDQFKKPILT